MTPVEQLRTIRRGWAVSFQHDVGDGKSRSAVGFVTDVTDDGFRVGVELAEGEGFSEFIPFAKAEELEAEIVDKSGEWEVEVIEKGPGVPGWEGPGPDPTPDQPLVSASRATSVIAEAPPPEPIDDPTHVSPEVMRRLIDVDDAAERDAAEDAAAFAGRIRGTEVPDAEKGRPLVTLHPPLVANTAAQIMLLVAEEYPASVVDSSDPSQLIIREKR